MILEALDEMELENDELQGSEYDESNVRDEEVEEASGVAALGGSPVIPLGMRTPGPRADIVNVTHRSFGGLGRNKRK